MAIDPDIIFSMLLTMGIFVVLSISLNLINGFTGMLSLGHIAFFGAGAYAAGLYMSAMEPALYSGAYWFHFLISCGVAGVVAAIFGMAVGIPCLRLEGDYLAIATLAFAEIFKIVLDSFMPEVFGGPRGLRLMDKMDSHWAFCVILGLIILAAFFARNLKSSAMGRAYFAIRENEIAARVMGMNLAFLKVCIFVMGSAIAGIAGAVFASSRYLIAPNDFAIMQTIMVLLMIVLGGQGSVTGSIVGALILSLVDPLVRYLPEIAANFSSNENLHNVLSTIKANPELIYAFLLIILIRLRPQGIFGMHEWTHYVFRKKAAVKEAQS